MERNHSGFVAKVLLLLLSSLLSQIQQAKSYSASPNDSKRLVRDVIEPYDRHLRPLWNQTKAIDVYFSFYLKNILEVDEIQKRIAINAWANFSWWDEIRAWNASEYNGIHILHPDPLEVWRPRTIVTNSMAARDMFADNYTPFYIFSSGATGWYPGTAFYLACDLDLTYFPFDTQVCSIIFLAQEFSSNIRFVLEVQTVLTNDYTPNGEWELTSSNVTHGNIEPWVTISVSFTFKRLPLYHLINVLIPVMTLSFLSVFGFVVPKDSGERASYSITVLLSLAVFFGVVGSQLPKDSKTFPIINIYLFIMVVLSAISVFVIITQLRLTAMYSESLSCSDQEFDQKYARGDGHPKEKAGKQEMDTRTRTSLPVTGTGGSQYGGYNLKDDDVSDRHNDKKGHVLFQRLFHNQVDTFDGKVTHNVSTTDGRNDVTNANKQRETTTTIGCTLCPTYWKVKKYIFEQADGWLFLIFTALWSIATVIFFYKMMNNSGG